MRRIVSQATSLLLVLTISTLCYIDLSSSPEIRDVAVVNVTVWLPYGAEWAYWGWKIYVNVTVRNEGDLTETFTVTAFAGSAVIGTQTVDALAPLQNETLTYVWATSNVGPYDPFSIILPPIDFTIKAEAEVLSGETDTADNTLVNGNVTVWWPGDMDGNCFIDVSDFAIFGGWFSYKFEYGQTGYNWRGDLNGDGVVDGRDFYYGFGVEWHDVAVVNASMTFPFNATAIYPCWAVNVTVTVRNWGSHIETFNITAFLDTVTIGINSITVEAGTKATYSIVGNTTGAMSYTDAQIVAKASLAYEDRGLSDNTLVNGTVWVRFPGDADDNGFVDITDFAILGKAWFATYPDARYDWQVDYDGDGTVDVSDFSILGDNWFKGP